MKRTTELKRRTPLRPCSPTKRRIKQKCKKMRCSRPAARGLDICLTHAKGEADRLFSLLVRKRGYCEAHARETGKYECRADLQCAHIISRRYLNVRWDTENALCLCAGHHAYFTHNPLEWEVWLAAKLLPRRLKLLREKALDRSLAKPDYASLIPRLRAQLRAAGGTV